MSVSPPVATSRPRARIATRLHSASASLSTCELKNTVHPRSRRPRISARTSRRPSGSRPDIGSSKITSSGSLRSACAMPTRCSMPLENLRSCSRRSPPMPTSIEQAARAPAALRGVVAEQRAEIHQQLLGGQVVVEVRVLRQVADPALDGQIAERPPENLGAAAGREHQLHEQLQRRRLARAVRAQKSEHLSLADVERQAVERPIRTLPPEADAVILGELVGGESAAIGTLTAGPQSPQRIDLGVLAFSAVNVSSLGRRRAAARRQSPGRRTASAHCPRPSRR